MLRHQSNEYHFSLAASVIIFTTLLSGIGVCSLIYLLNFIYMLGKHTNFFQCHRDRRKERESPDYQKIELFTKTTTHT